MTCPIADLANRALRSARVVHLGAIVMLVFDDGVSWMLMAEILVAMLESNLCMRLSKVSHVFSDEVMSNASMRHRSAR